MAQSYYVSHQRSPKFEGPFPRLLLVFLWSHRCQTISSLMFFLCIWASFSSPRVDSCWGHLQSSETASAPWAFWGRGDNMRSSHSFNATWINSIYTNGWNVPPRWFVKSPWFALPHHCHCHGCHSLLPAPLLFLTIIITSSTDLGLFSLFNCISNNSFHIIFSWVNLPF